MDTQPPHPRPHFLPTQGAERTVRRSNAMAGPATGHGTWPGPPRHPEFTAFERGHRLPAGPVAYAVDTFRAGRTRLTAIAIATAGSTSRGSGAHTATGSRICGPSLGPPLGTGGVVLVAPEGSTIVIGNLLGQ